MRRYLKAICVLLCISFCLLLPAGCDSKEEKNISATEIADELKNLSSEDITWVEISSHKLSSYFNFGADSVDEYKGYINDNEDAYDIIAVFKSENRNDVITGINHLVAELETTYKVASKNVFDKVNKKIIAEKDDYIILCIVDSYDKANKYLTETLEAQIIS